MIERTDDPEVKARLVRMATNCPSGRLEIFLEGGEAVEPEFTPSIATVANGPLWVRGGIKIEAPDGFIYEVRNRVTLCRCGLSKTSLSATAPTSRADLWLLKVLTCKQNNSETQT